MSFWLLAAPAWRIAVCFVAACAADALTDRLSTPPAARLQYRATRDLAGRLIDRLARIPMFLLVFEFFFAISWRPLYCAGATISFFLIFTGISRAKYEFIREPLIFSDIALVADLFRHREIFYATWLNVIFWVVALTYVFGASALFMIYEPPVLPATRPWLSAAILIALVAAVLLFLFNRAYRALLSRIAMRLFGTDSIHTITLRLGTFTAVAWHFLMWLGRPPRRDPAAAPVKAVTTPPPTDSGEPLLVVWQSESFIDMRHFGVAGLSLPNLDRLRERAVDWGRLLSVFEGGYTLRTEFAVLSGVDPDTLGADSAYPYLRAGRYADVAWPMRFRRAGWTTHFVHPWDRRFFSRHKALPRLGFDELSMLDSFDHNSARDGQYVSDLALARRVLSVCRAGPQPAGQFVFAASMENHGPWEKGRAGELSDPLDIYLSILERSDAALGFLAGELDGFDRPVWLVFYGDHAPMLKSFANPFPDSRTDYLVVPLGRARRNGHAAVPPSVKAPWGLLDDVVGLLHPVHGDPQPDPGGARDDAGDPAAGES